MVNEIELVYLSQLNKLLLEVINGNKQMEVEELQLLQPHLAALCNEAKKQHTAEIIQSRQKK